MFCWSLTKCVFISPQLLLVFHCWPLRSEDINFSAALKIVNTPLCLPPKPPILLMLITVLWQLMTSNPLTKLLPASATTFHALCVLWTITTSINQCWLALMFSLLSSAGVPPAPAPPRLSSPASSCPSPARPCSRTSPSPPASATTSPWAP